MITFEIRPRGDKQHDGTPCFTTFGHMSLTRIAFWDVEKVKAAEILDCSARTGRLQDGDKLIEFPDTVVGSSNMLETWPQAPTLTRIRGYNELIPSICSQATPGNELSAPMAMTSVRVRICLPPGRPEVHAVSHPPGKRALGCARALKPSRGVGIDFSAGYDCEGESRISRSGFWRRRRRDPATPNAIEGPFDYIVIAVRYVRGYRCHACGKIYGLCAVDAHHHCLLFGSAGTGPKLAELLRIRNSSRQSDHIATADFLNLTTLADWSDQPGEWQLLPLRWFRLGPSINRFIARLPGIRGRLRTIW